MHVVTELQIVRASDLFLKLCPGILCAVMCVYHILRKSSFSDFLVAFLEHSGTAHQSMTCKTPKEKLLLLHENNMKKKVGKTSS